MRDNTGKAIVAALVLLAGSFLLGAGVIASAVQHDNFGTIPMFAGVVLGLIGLVSLAIVLTPGGPPAGP